MQYVRSISGSVSKTWNSINPATLSGAIDVIVVEQEDGTLACSPFHVRFGKFSLLRPSEKKVEFRVNDVKQDYAMKLGDGGEAFFVFETTQAIPADLQTSPPVSPDASPQPQSLPESLPAPAFAEPEPLDLGSTSGSPPKIIKTLSGEVIPRLPRQSQSDLGKRLEFRHLPSTLTFKVIFRRSLEKGHWVLSPYQRIGPRRIIYP